MTLFDIDTEPGALGQGVTGSEHPGQWRLSAVEVVNWGTFHGHHRVQIARQGHLLAGHSGSGKSSLLDAISTVLTPGKWLQFNAAAQDASARGGDRSLVSYVRGAWRKQTDEETGEAVSRYLRNGATWSGILLRFDNGTSETPVTLVRLFHIRRGSNARGDLKELHLLLRDDASLLDFTDYVSNGIDVRRIKTDWPEATVTDQHSVFAARFRRILGIGSENALLLLHRTQSAKNLGSLDQLFRNFMLDVPGTFDLADTAVEQFDNLSRAYQLVVEARRQVEQLTLLRQPSADYEVSTAEIAEVDQLIAAIDAYQARRMLELTRRERDELTGEQAQAISEEARIGAVVDAARREHDAARARVNQLGGPALDAEEERLRSATEAANRTDEHWAQVAGELGDVGVSMPQTAEAFEELRLAARTERDDLLRATARGEDLINAQHEKRASTKAEIEVIDRELQQFRGRRSNIDPSLLAARTMIAEALSLSESALPFAGELIEVAAEYSAWTGAIERVVRPLAVTMLVRDENIREVSRVVDGLHLGTRLVYESVRAVPDAPKPARTERSLLYRLRVADGPTAAWLNHRLSETYDFECVDDVSELAGATKAVTISGQIKTSATRYEKDDRRRIDDRSRWVLGADNTAKVEDLITRRQVAEQALHAAEKAIVSANAQRDAATRRVTVLGRLDSLSWQGLDRTAAHAAVTRQREQLARLSTGNLELGEAQAAESAAAEREESAHRDHAAARAVAADLARRIAVLEGAVVELSAQQGSEPLPTQIIETLDARYRSVKRAVSRESLPEISRRVAEALHRQSQIAHDRRRRAQDTFGVIALQFRTEWPAAAGDLTTSIDDRVGYLGLLESVIGTGLPQHEARFAALLREQAQQLTGHLLAEIRDAPAQIRARIEPVNESLLRSLFDRDRHLQIQVKDRRSDEVKAFMADLQAVSAGAWGEEDLAAAEQRFAILREVMRRLGSGDGADRSWRTRCLDTREHVSFTGVEVDLDGREVNIHDSSAGLSGGQRQKLVIFCLAAALRYQLAEDEHDVPDYGTIILDEAFDKADSEYTTMAMDVFVTFGFHMILATPLKLLQTIEPYVGAVSHVTCRDFQDSRIGTLAIEHDDEDG